MFKSNSIFFNLRLFEFVHAIQNVFYFFFSKYWILLALRFTFNFRIVHRIVCLVFNICEYNYFITITFTKYSITTSHRRYVHLLENFCLWYEKLRIKLFKLSNNSFKSQICTKAAQFLFRLINNFDLPFIAILNVLKNNQFNASLVNIATGHTLWFQKTTVANSTLLSVFCKNHFLEKYVILFLK